MYDGPYPDPSSRRPVLQWPREIPIDGQAADVVAIVERYDVWLAASGDVPKLLLTFDAPTPLGSSSIIAWARETIAALEVRGLGVAGHHATEDLPHEIGEASAGFLARRCR